mmetsp:Transcript_27396/g.66515  ORF Transcript_27396/g.66515 Transcript_27396/m.66515 type:complete len:213 (-) Transcript_27396:343-981(-)
MSCCFTHGPSTLVFLRFLLCLGRIKSIAFTDRVEFFIQCFDLKYLETFAFGSGHQLGLEIFNVGFMCRDSLLQLLSRCLALQDECSVHSFLLLKLSFPLVYLDILGSDGPLLVGTTGLAIRQTLSKILALLGFLRILGIQHFYHLLQVHDFGFLLFNLGVLLLDKGFVFITNIAVFIFILLELVQGGNEFLFQVFWLLLLLLSAPTRQRRRW